MSYSDDMRECHREKSLPNTKQRGLLETALFWGATILVAYAMYRLTCIVAGNYDNIEKIQSELNYLREPHSEEQWLDDVTSEGVLLPVESKVK